MNNSSCFYGVIRMIGIAGDNRTNGETDRHLCRTGLGVRTVPMAFRTSVCGSSISKTFKMRMHLFRMKTVRSSDRSKMSEVSV